MFGHDSLPTRVYVYGAKSPATDPPAFLGNQLYAAHKYQNGLTEIERGRRTRVRAAADVASPELVAANAAVDAAVAELDAAEAAIALANSAARSRKGAADPARERVRAARRRAREARAAAKVLRSALYADPAFKVQAKAIDADAHAADLAARAASGLYHGTYLEAESAARKGRSAKGMPRFKRFDGDGKAGTQVQGGVTLAEAMSGTDTRFQIRLDGDGRKPWAVLRVRVGSIGRKPIWAECRVRWHRSFPDDAVVKWAYVLRRRVGLTDHWAVLLTVSRAGGFPDRGDRVTSGVVNIRRRWTQTPAGLRVAAWTGDDGRSGELVLAADRVAAYAAADGITATADIRFNDAMATVTAWRKGDAVPATLSADRAYVARRATEDRQRLDRGAFGKPSDRKAVASHLRSLDARLAAIDGLVAAWPAGPPAVTAAFAEQFQHAHAWRSSGRLARVAYWFRDNPADAPVALAAFIEQWRRHDKHLRNFAAHRKRRFQNWRREQYRLFAVDLRRRYAKCEMAKLDVAEMARYPKAEDPDPVVLAIRWNQRTASPGFLAATVMQFGPDGREACEA